MLEEQNTEHVEEVNETENDETISTGEDETTSESESSEQSSSDSEQSGGSAKERAKSQIDRLKAKVKELEEGGKEGNQKSSKKEEVGDDRYERLELKTEGITSKKEQDVVLEYARFKGIEVLEAMKTPAVKAELAEIRAKESVPTPSNRTNGGVNTSLEYYASQIRNGKMRLTDITDQSVRKQLTKMKIF